MKELNYFIVGTIFYFIYTNEKLSVSKWLLEAYSNKIFQISFLLTLLYFGDQNIPLTLFIAFNWLYIGLKINESELLKNL
jgi:hypothetical protein